MKNKQLSMALAAALVGTVGLASVAGAQQSVMTLNSDGLGQVLIYPYYTVNKDQATLISVVNTTNQTKAVKVRFLEGRNSREVLDFNLYLSPFDVWTGSVTDVGVADGPGVLATSDTSCTAPSITRIGGTVAFRPFEYTGENEDDGPQDIARTREGYVEMIEMGVVINNGDLGDGFVEQSGGSRRGTAFASAIKHGTDGVPANCGIIEAAWNPGTGIWWANPDVDMLPPVGGLFGSASIVNVQLGTIIGYNADAVEGFYAQQGFRTVDGQNFWNTLHFEPGDILPSLANAANQPDGSSTAVVFEGGNLVELNFVDRGVAPVSAVFMYDAILNEFLTSTALGADSEWVVTFPTKRQHIEAGVFVPGASDAHVVIQEMRPFTDWFDTTGDGLVFDANGSCESIGITSTAGGGFYDREEGPYSTSTNIDFSPRPPGGAPLGLSLCYEAQVLAFNQANVGEGNEASKVLGSTYARNLNLPVSTGWAQFKMGRDTIPGAASLGNTRGNFLPEGAIIASDGVTSVTNSGDVLFGLPVTGFWAMQVARTDAGSALANYSAAWRHHGKRARGRFTQTAGPSDNPAFVPGCTTTDPNTGNSVACRNITSTVSLSRGSAL